MLTSKLYLCWEKSILANLEGQNLKISLARRAQPWWGPPPTSLRHGPSTFHKVSTALFKTLYSRVEDSSPWIKVVKIMIFLQQNKGY